MKKNFDPRLKIIPRSDWGAKPAKSVVRMTTPPSKTWIHHTADGGFPRQPNWKERTFFSSACGYVRQLQSFHQNGRGWSDIAYSFVILKPFFRRMWVFEGRGWMVVGAHTEGTNSTSYGFCVAGNYENEKVGKRLIYTVRRLIERGLATGNLAGGRDRHPTGGHRDAPGAATACPGKFLHAELAAMRKPTKRWRKAH